MFNRNFKHQIRGLEADVEELKTQVRCLRGVHVWGVSHSMRIACRDCRTLFNESQGGESQ